jgi:predicted nucleotidyltransferase
MWSYRIAPKHRAVMRKVATALTRDPGVARVVAVAIEGRAAPDQAVGAFKSEAAALGFIRDRLVVSLQPEAIWLFGSRARGDHRRDSDFDILVVLPDALGAKARDYRHALEPLLGSGLPCDVLPCSAADFEQAKNEPGTIVHAAVTEGQLLYAKRRRGGRR